MRAPAARHDPARAALGGGRLTTQPPRLQRPGEVTQAALQASHAIHHRDGAALPHEMLRWPALRRQIKEHDGTIVARDAAALRRLLGAAITALSDLLPRCHSGGGGRPPHSTSPASDMSRCDRRYTASWARCISSGAATRATTGRMWITRKSGTALWGRIIGHESNNGSAMGLSASYCELGDDTGLRSLWAHILQGQAARLSQAMSAAIHPLEDTWAKLDALAPVGVARAIEVPQVCNFDAPTVEDNVHVAPAVSDTGTPTQR